jgi:hypothetical protein
MPCFIVVAANDNDMVAVSSDPKAVYYRTLNSVSTRDLWRHIAPHDGG